MPFSESPANPIYSRRYKSINKQIGHAFHSYGFVRFLSVMAIKLQALYALLALLAPSPAAY